MVRFVVVVVALLYAACGGSSSQIEVKGEESRIDGLAGLWEGTYVGVDSGRTGTIRFDLTVGRHTADGEVVMFPGGDASKGTPLRVRFVEVKEDDTVRGRIEPYTDPSCSCSVATEFTGTLTGDAIEGTFTTRVVDSDQTQTGQWSVRRSK